MISLTSLSPDKQFYKIVSNVIKTKAANDHAENLEDIFISNITYDRSSVDSPQTLKVHVRRSFKSKF